uniref:Chemokine interleukin-8-like domain-containing protein n=1 Tax=Electrophorus electricus TaxID=8005 RepID=A0A4W4G0L2_ELEEL
CEAAILILLLLLGVLVAVVKHTMSLSSVGTPQTCCFDFFNGKIPVNKIKKIEKLDSRCANPGFLVTTEKRQICVGEDLTSELEND